VVLPIGNLVPGSQAYLKGGSTKKVAPRRLDDCHPEIRIKFPRGIWSDAGGRVRIHRQMIQQQWGRVINLTRIDAFNGADVMSSATEMGLVGFTREIAR